MAVKKTTLMIESGLYDALRSRAITRGQSISATVSEALRRYMSVSEPTQDITVNLPIVDLGRLKVPAEIFESNARLNEFLEPLEYGEGKLGS